MNSPKSKQRLWNAVGKHYFSCRFGKTWKKLQLHSLLKRAVQTPEKVFEETCLFGRCMSLETETHLHLTSWTTRVTSPPSPWSLTAGMEEAVDS